MGTPIVSHRMGTGGGQRKPVLGAAEVSVVGVGRHLLGRGIVGICGQGEPGTAGFMKSSERARHWGRGCND